MAEGTPPLAHAFGERKGEARPPARKLPSATFSRWERVRAALTPWVLLLVGLTVAGLAYGARYGIPPQLTWDRPRALYLLGLVPLLALIHFHFERRASTRMLFSRGADLRRAAHGWSHHLVCVPRVLRLVAVFLIALAIARPQRPSVELAEIEGIDIIVALDVSNSMSEQDLKPDRITVAKKVLKRFVERRKSDRIGLVIFGKDAFTQCPLTLDHRTLDTLLDDVRIGLIDGKATAIGNALGTALNRLRKSDAKSRIIILLTDGDNNAGNLAPEQAARYAQSLGVKVFTILMGRDVAAASTGPFNLRPQPRYPINPKLLEQIAQETGGTPYLATDAESLEQRFQVILDELDRSRFKEQRGKPDEQYLFFVFPALLLLLAELALALTRFRRFP